MRNFYLKQKFLALRDRYKIYDESQNVAYHCEGKFISLSSKMELFDTQKNEKIFTIKRKIISLMPTYYLYRGKQVVAKIKKNIAFFSYKMSIKSTIGDFKIKGNILAYDFTIYDCQTPIVDVHKKIFSFGDTYEIAIHDDQDIELIIALVIVLDNCVHNHKKKIKRK